MIYDSIKNFTKYCNLNPCFTNILKYMTDTELDLLEQGRYEIGNGAFGLVSEYYTKSEEDGFIECHKKYIDIQIMIKGIEVVGICNKNECKENGYNEEKDYQKLEGEVNYIKLKEGYFLIFFPDDGHMPQLNYANKPEKVKKLVIKVPV